MTDKIIIDGVDVSGWTLEEIEYHLQHKPKLQMFRAYADIYKQLQAEQQKVKELEEFKAKLLKPVIMPQIEPEVINLTEKYKQVLEEIKEMIHSLRTQTVLTFPDFNMKQNVKFVMNQYNKSLDRILQKCEVLEDE